MRPNAAISTMNEALLRYPGTGEYDGHMKPYRETTLPIWCSTCQRTVMHEGSKTHQPPGASKWPSITLSVDTLYGLARGFRCWHFQTFVLIADRPLRDVSALYSVICPCTPLASQPAVFMTTG